MYVIMVHWLVKKGIENEDAFENKWKRMSVDPDSGLFREILTTPASAEDSKFNTFSLTNESYKTYINIGIWKDLESFDAAIAKYIQEPERRVPLNSEDNEEKLAVYLEDFEFKIRERIVLKKISDRTGSWDLPVADL